MSRFEQSFIDLLLDKVDLVEVVGLRVELKKQGRDYGALCPFHSEKSPSFTVSPVKQFYHCFGCGAHGTAISFLMEYDGMQFRDAVAELAGKVGMALPADEPLTPVAAAKKKLDDEIITILARAKTVFQKNLQRFPNAVKYMKGRGLTRESVIKFGLGYSHSDITQSFPDVSTEGLVAAGLVVNDDEHGEIYDKFRHRIMFPIHNQHGDIVGFGGRVLDDGMPKYMNSPESAVFQKGNELYGLFMAKNDIRKSRTGVVLEGYMDVIMLHQHGDARAVAALGTSITEQQIAKLYRIADELVFCFDGDKAGRAAAARAARLVLSSLSEGKTAKFLILPEEHDPDSYVIAHGVEAWMVLVAQESITLSAMLVNLLQAEHGIDTPEQKAAFAVGAAELVAAVVNSPSYKSALRSYFETVVGLRLPERRSAARRAAAPSNDAPELVEGVMQPDARKMAFYENFALLCSLNLERAQIIPETMLDDFAALISSWFSVTSTVAHERTVAVVALRNPPLKRVIADALLRAESRASSLPPDALVAEVDAVITTMRREVRRARTQSSAEALFQ